MLSIGVLSDNLGLRTDSPKDSELPNFAMPPAARNAIARNKITQANQSEEAAVVTRDLYRRRRQRPDRCRLIVKLDVCIRPHRQLNAAVPGAI